MAKKFAFIGAGSFGFTRKLVKDILTYPAFADAEIALMDINTERLSWITKAVNKIIEMGNYKAKVISTTSRKEALMGADIVLVTVLSGGVDVWRYDIEIPKKYGVDFCVRDTRGVAGIFRALRTIPLMLDICKDMERYCPNATMLNYTNPMAMLCRAMQEKFPDLKITGLCHSVQGTASELAELIGAPMNEITYLCAGVNHQAWYIKYEWNGKDAYPLIKKAVMKKKFYDQNKVKVEMFKYLDYFTTEGSSHNSEYNAWFRKRPDLIKKFCHVVPEESDAWGDGSYAALIRFYLRRKTTWKKQIQEWLDSKDIDLKRGHEYAASISNAIVGDNTLFEFNGNVRNFNLIENVPYGCCVEVPVVASKNGLRSVHVGPLPEHLAVLCNITARTEELAVEAAITGDERKAFHAVCFDPLSSAVLSLDEIHAMVQEMFRKNRKWLPQFKHIK